MTQRNRHQLWSSYAKTAALVVGLPALLVLGEVLRSYATAEGAGALGPWVLEELSTFTGAYAYLFLATSLTALIVGTLVKRSLARQVRERRLARRTLLRSRAEGAIEPSLQAREVGRGRVLVPTPRALREETQGVA